MRLTIGTRRTLVGCLPAVNLLFSSPRVNTNKQLLLAQKHICVCYAYNVIDRQLVLGTVKNNGQRCVQIRSMFKLDTIVGMISISPTGYT